MIDATPQRRPSAAPVRRLAATLLLTALLGLLLAVPATVSAAAASSPATPSATAASTTSTADAMAADILGWLNRDRAAAGLRPLRAWSTMTTLANQRSGNMASAQVLSHNAAGGDPGRALTASGLQWYSFGENIGVTSYPWGSQAAASLYSMWKASPTHHAIMFSGTYNYIGVGIARSSDGTTWSSVLFTESADHTPAAARNGSLTRVGATSLHLTWSGSDPLLQTHTAGLRGFNVQYRVDGGTWYQIRTNTTMTWLGLSNRAHRHTYSFRVQASDKRGNLSGWTAEKRIWVP